MPLRRLSWPLTPFELHHTICNAVDVAEPIDIKRRIGFKATRKYFKKDGSLSSQRLRFFCVPRTWEQMCKKIAAGAPNSKAVNRLRNAVIMAERAGLIVWLKDKLAWQSVESKRKYDAKHRVLQTVGEYVWSIGYRPGGTDKDSVL